MADRKRKRMVQQQPDRRANRTILVRTLFLLTLFGVAAFVPLLVRLLLDHTLSLSVCHGWLTSLKKSRLPLSRGIG